MEDRVFKVDKFQTIEVEVSKQEYISTMEHKLSNLVEIYLTEEIKFKKAQAEKKRKLRALKENIWAISVDLEGLYDKPKDSLEYPLWAFKERNTSKYSELKEEIESLVKIKNAAVEVTNE